MQHRAVLDTNVIGVDRPTKQQKDITTIIELVPNSKHANLLNENEVEIAVEIAVTIDGAYTRIFDVYGKPTGRKNGFTPTGALSQRAIKQSELKAVLKFLTDNNHI